MKPDRALLGHTVRGVNLMTEQKKPIPSEDLRLDPERRLCAKFDPTSIALFPVAPWDEMSFRVLDNCAEEHMM